MLTDIWRDRNPNEKYYTWYRNLEQNSQKASRLDNILTSIGLTTKIKNITHLPSILSDHSACLVIIDQIKYNRGPGYWKLNTSLLQDSNFVAELKKEIEATIRSFNQNKNDPIERWELIKKRIKRRSQELSRLNASTEKLIISQLAEQADILLHQMPLTEKDTKLLYDTQNDLNDIALKRAKGIIFRGKAKWAEEGEKNTKYFFNLEKERYSARCCHQLVNDSNEIITDFDTVVKMQEDFYRELYTTNPEVNFTEVNTTDIKLESSRIESLKSDFKETEFRQAVKQMNVGKSPGNDGIPIELYKVMWDELEASFIEMFNAAQNKGILPKSLREGVLKETWQFKTYHTAE